MGKGPLMADDERIDRFLELSRLLLEMDGLSPETGAVYLAMLDDLDPEWPLTAMARHLLPLGALPPAEREHLIMRALHADEAWHTAAFNLQYVWYIGSLSRPDTSFVHQPPEAYLGALVWPLLGTQAPGLPGPFFGEWAYPPTRAGSPVRVGDPSGEAGA
jgi:hypothetical protein